MKYESINFIKDCQYIRTSPTFSMIIYSGLMKNLKWLKQLQIHMFLLGDIWKQMQTSSNYIKKKEISIFHQYFWDHWCIYS